MDFRASFCRGLLETFTSVAISPKISSTRASNLRPGDSSGLIFTASANQSFPSRGLSFIVCGNSIPFIVYWVSTIRIVKPTFLYRAYSLRPTNTASKTLPASINGANLFATRFGKQAKRSLLNSFLRAHFPHPYFDLRTIF
jgi:hypothetical protein